MKQLPADRRKEFETHKAELNRLQARMNDAAGAYNEAKREAWEKFAEAQSDFIQALGNAQDFVNEVGAKLQEYHADRSEKWQEGEAGQAFEAWASAWADCDLTHDEVDEPDDLPDAVEEPVAAFEALPEGVDDV